MSRCVGAFRRVCFMLTDRILCDACWQAVSAEGDMVTQRFPQRYWPVEMREHAPPGSHRAPFRGDVW